MILMKSTPDFYVGEWSKCHPTYRGDISFWFVTWVSQNLMQVQSFAKKPWPEAVKRWDSHNLGTTFSSRAQFECVPFPEPKLNRTMMGRKKEGRAD